MIICVYTLCKRRKFYEKNTSSNECYCFILRNIASSIKKIYNQHFQELDITNEQFSILMHMKYLTPISVTNLSEKIKIDRMYCTQNLGHKIRGVVYNSFFF